MPLDFRHSPSGRRGGIKPPPNYLSRRIQRRALMLTGLLLLVVVAMQEVRDPKYVQWVWDLPKQAAMRAQQAEELDTRARHTPTADKTTNLGPMVTIAQSNDFTLPESDADNVGSDAGGETEPDLLQVARIDAWARLLKSLPKDQRKLLLSSLKRARDDRPLAEAEVSAWPTLVSRLDEGWQLYLEEARAAIDEDDAQTLTDDEIRRWAEIIEELRQDWDDHARPALSALTNIADLTVGQHATLQRIQAACDQVFFRAIQDNTVFPAAETDAWYRLLEDLQSRSAADLRQASLGNVGFGQLFKQPDQYRCKLVTVYGSVRSGYYRTAPENIYGIQGYYVLWLKPANANSPIVIYSLGMPANFPHLQTMNAGEEVTDLEEDVEITGYFFKRWPYRAQDGTRLAPLLLAKVPEWKDESELMPTSGRLPSVTLWVVMLGGCCLFGVIIAYVAYRASVSAPRSRTRDTPSTRESSSS